MSKQNGFSLIEVIVTMAIAAIVLSVAVPGFQSYTQNNRQTVVINELSSALQLARNSAITRRQRVTVCKSANGTDCIIAGTWTQGWMVFADTDESNTRDINEDILRVHGAIHSNVAFFSGGGNTDNLVAFGPRGILASRNGTITYCDSRGDDFASSLVISRTGRVRFEDNRGNLACP